MIVRTEKLSFASTGKFASWNLTERARMLVESSGLQEGSLTVFYQHTTGAVLVIEHETGILADLEDALEAMTPVDGSYLHYLRAVDFNGASHIRNALLGVSVTIPVSAGELMLGKYQEIIAIDMQLDDNPRNILIQVMGI
jgi:secondary thiamine-phosphate synthase enzyme